MYTVQHPDYIDVLTTGSRTKGGAKLKKFDKMFNAVRDEAPGMRRVYRELSEYAHFGPLAIFNVHRLEDEAKGVTTWTDAPHWRDEKHFKIACAQTWELVVAAQHYLDELGATATNLVTTGTAEIITE